MSSRGEADSVSLSQELRDKVGLFEVQNGVFLEILEKQTFKQHRHFRGSLPHSNGIEAGFDAGPIFTVYAEDGYVDLRAGLTLIGDRVVRETAVVPKLVARYDGVTKAELAAARVSDESRIVLPLASQRMGNYCRWWLDSVAKIFVTSRSSILRQKLRGSTWDVVAPELPTAYQREAVKLFDWRPLITSNTTDRLLRGRSVNSSGLTFGGGQRIGGMVREMARFLDLLIPPATNTNPEEIGELVYISRNEASMRRILNEDELVPGLRKLGFKIVSPGKQSLTQQIETFRNARVVLAPHGAGLTNIVFCRPRTTLIEIFPEGGVHGSAFLRIASHLRFNYYFIVGEKVDTPQGLKNPNNSDIVLNVNDVLKFVREAVQA